MEKNWFILLLFVLGAIAVIVTVIIKNRKDRKGLFKKLSETIRIQKSLIFNLILSIN